MLMAYKYLSEVVKQTVYKMYYIQFPVAFFVRNFHFDSILCELTRSEDYG